jgi:hypothetical protein
MVRDSCRILSDTDLALGFLFPNYVSKAACRERIVYRTMAHERIHERILDYVS